MSQAKVHALDWRVSLKIDAGNGVPTPEAGNAYLMLTNGVWAGCLAYDEFGDRTYWAKAPPGMAQFNQPQVGQDVSDADALYIQHYLSRIGVEFMVSFKVEAIHAAVEAAARRNAHNPLKEYLRALKWDGEERLKRWCSECLLAEQCDYASAVGTWWMISAVARALEPGCQADHMLILEGEQGARKSTALRILGGDWYLPELPDVQHKDAAHLLNGRWIVECGELNILSRSSSMNAVKDFLTRPVDVYRKPYGRHVVRRPRSVVFAATTNNFESLNDPTGARRFWPLRCGNIDCAKLKKWRDQLWAEAVYRFEAGEQWHPTSELNEVITEQQEERFQEDSWTSIILAGAERHQLAPFSLSDCFNWLAMPPDKWTRAGEARIGAILQRAGYRSSRQRLGERRVRVYSKPGSLVPAADEESDFPE